MLGVQPVRTFGTVDPQIIYRARFTTLSHRRQKQKLPIFSPRPRALHPAAENSNKGERKSGRGYQSQKGKITKRKRWSLKESEINTGERVTIGSTFQAVA